MTHTTRRRLTAAALAAVLTPTITAACQPKPDPSPSPTLPPLSAILTLKNPGNDGPIREAFFAVHTLTGLAQVNAGDPAPVSRTVILRLDAAGLTPDMIGSEVLPAVGVVVTGENIPGRWVWQVINASRKPVVWTFAAHYQATAALDILGCAVTYEGLVVNKDGPYQARRVGDQLEAVCTFTL